MTDELVRKRKVRGAHRGSVTRITGKVSEALESDEPPDLVHVRLSQYKVALSEKLDVLSKLDNELLEMVEEDDLDHEVEQADLVKERIGLCIMEIDRFLEPASGRTAGRSTTPTVIAGTSEPLTEATVSVTDTTTSSDVAVVTSTPATPTIVTTATTARPTTTVIPSHNVKLPKLSIRKFGGDLTKWVTFWDSFDSSIHSNPTLSNVDKFNYLNSFLESIAAESIAGLTLTSANYEEAVTTLKRRFGNTQLIVNKQGTPPPT